MGFVADKVAVKQVFLAILWFPLPITFDTALGWTQRKEVNF
jgi:hypothetical protein